MSNIEQLLHAKLITIINNLYGVEISPENIQLQDTRKEFEGDITMVVFPLLKISKKKPEDTADEIGKKMMESVDIVQKYNVVKGFLNLTIADVFWKNQLNYILNANNFGIKQHSDTSKNITIEYSSPNTNKPLHLGHIRNNLLGFAIANILEANGHHVHKVNLVNDRGIHICKSMLAWSLFGNNETPESTGKKGDHLVGDYYVRFDKEYKKEIETLKASGVDEETAKKEAPLMKQAQEMLRKWEHGDKEVNDLWAKMNRWVYDGFDVTYKTLGVDFEKIYYESETYKFGRDIVLKGLENGVFFQKEDGSIWADLTGDGLDQKLLLRSDGTSVYMTQDIGTANLRFQDYQMDEMIYVVGNEQNYHFQVLALVLQKLGFKWAEKLYHLSYGMVELPEGKMKSREGTVVDADDLMDEMVKTARQMSESLGKLDGYENEEKERTYSTIGLGALKYFILKVDPKKNMTFDPKDSIDFNGNTGPFIQYTHARICSLLTKAVNTGISINNEIPSSVTIGDEERALIKKINHFPTIIAEAGTEMNPGHIANYTYDLVKQFNQFYQECTILKHEDRNIIIFRLQLSKVTANIIKTAMKLLGIDVPERM